MNETHVKLLGQIIKNLNNVQKWLLHSYEVCQTLDPEDSVEKNQDAFEALTSRYARSVDMLSNKIFRTIDILEMETPGSVIDVINRAHKRGLIFDSERFRLYKDLRNSIAHEYSDVGLHKIFSLVQEYTPEILKIIDCTQDYLRKFLKN